MPRDYKHRAQRKPKKKPLPGWLWLLTGLLLGGFIVGLVWLKGMSADGGGEWVGARPDRPPTGKPEAARRVEVPPPPKPRFDFYNVLPEMEVVVPEEELAPASPAVRDAHVEGPGNFLVQIGSFRRADDAESLKAQLALLGLEARVVSARVDAQGSVYRVRSGPFVGKDAVNRVRKRLADNGYRNSMVIRVESN